MTPGIIIFSFIITAIFASAAWLIWLFIEGLDDTDDHQ